MSSINRNSLQLHYNSRQQLYERPRCQVAVALTCRALNLCVYETSISQQQVHIINIRVDRVPRL